MTMNEICTENGYRRETARRKLIKAVKICKEKNQIEI
jgi:putative hemolysin